MQLLNPIFLKVQLERRVAIFQAQNYSAEHGIDGNFDLFRRISVSFHQNENAGNSNLSHSAEDEKSLEFHSEQFLRREKRSDLPNFVLNNSTEDKNARTIS
jgi:hypothetical protein